MEQRLIINSGSISTRAKAQNPNRTKVDCAFFKCSLKMGNTKEQKSLFSCITHKKFVLLLELNNEIIG